MSNENSTLTLAAREAIRSYIRRSVLWPASVVAVIATVGAGVGGYAINEFAASRAGQEAYKNATESLMRAVSHFSKDGVAVITELRNDMAKADEIIEGLKKTKTRLTLLESEATEKAESIGKINETIKELGAPSDINELYDGLANRLANNSEFRAEVSGDMNDRIEELDSLWTMRRSPSDAMDVSIAGDGAWGKWYDASCPDNHYVCGLGQKIEPPQGRDDDTAMNAVRFKCCAL